MIQYKSVPGPVGITISRKEDFASAVKQYASIIDRESVGGWKFECIRKIPVTKKAGCLASLFGKEDTTLYMNILVFSKDDSDHISPGTVNKHSEIANSPISSFTPNSTPNSEAPEIVSTYSPIGTESNFSTDNVKTGGKKNGVIVAAVLAVIAIIVGIAVSSSNRSNRYDDYNDGYITEEDYIDPVYKDEREVSNGARNFCNMASGIWVDMDNVRQDGGLVIFDFLIIQDGTIATGTYPGEYSRQGQIVDATNYDDGVIELTVFYPEVNNLLDGYCEPYTGKYEVEIDGNTLVLRDSGMWRFEYMGSTLDEAIENIPDYGYLDNDEDNAPFYGIWCAAYVSAQDAENLVRNMKKQNLDGEVIITSEWECLNPTKYYVVTAGRYSSKSDAESVLETIKYYYPDAYIKYTGNRLAN